MKIISDSIAWDGKGGIPNHWHKSCHFVPGNVESNPDWKAFNGGKRSDQEI